MQITERKCEIHKVSKEAKCQHSMAIVLTVFRNNGDKLRAAEEKMIIY